MLVENINATLTGNNKKNEPHDKGWGILEQATIALVVLFVIVVVLGSLYALRTRTNVATETAVSRDPRWGRASEGFGEDTYLTSTMGKTMVEAMQGKSPADRYSVMTSGH